jgi:nucleoside 2-deoxyribosyltransferase
MKNEDKKRKSIDCFISMPFTDEFDDVHIGILNVNQYIKEYIIDFVRLDIIAYEHRRIEENVLKNIDHSHLLVADISRYPESAHPNVSVMHEIGYACGKNIPFILIGNIGSQKILPSNLKGSIVTEYDPKNDNELKDFSHRLAQQFEKTIREEVLNTVRGQFQAEVFSERHRINIPALIENTERRIYILTTNLAYTYTYLKESIEKALNKNDKNPTFKVEILTMDPESDVANARAVQLGRPIRQYRDELRSSLDKMRRTFGESPRVEIATYRSLPTQMTFILDSVVVTAVVSIGQQSREGIHFVLGKTPLDPFLSHFRVLKTLAIANLSS